MATYSVRMACGHTEDLKLFGKVADRARRIQYLEKYGECSACRKARLERERAEENAAGAEMNRSAGLQALCGTPKQIDWAESIRAKHTNALMQMLEKAAKLGASDDPVPTAARAVLSQTSAPWWIERRTRTTNDLIREMMPPVPVPPAGGR